MTFIPVDFDSAVEAKPAVHGYYNLQITACQEVKTGPNSKKPGSPQFKVNIGFQDAENVPNMTQFISLPNEDDEPDSARFKLLLLKRFLTLFKVGYDKTGIDTEQLAFAMIGSSAKAEVTVSEPDDSGNIYNRLVIPRLKDER